MAGVETVIHSIEVSGGSESGGASYSLAYYEMFLVKAEVATTFRIGGDLG